MRIKRWYEISKNPNIPEVKAARQHTLVAARSEILVGDRVHYLSDLVKGKDVLDVGVVNHTSDAANEQRWLHKCLVESARNCLGVDILEEEVHKLRSQGFNIVCADITKGPLEQKFDFIICGEVLEHVDAPGQFLASCAAMLNTGGRLILTVPNPWYIGYMMKNIVNGPPLEDNVDHVAWFDPCTLCELGERHGLAIDSFRGIRHTEHSRRFIFFKRKFFGLTPLFIGLGFRPELFAKAMIFEFVLGES